MMKPSRALFYLNVVAAIFSLAIMGTSIAVPLAHAGDIKSMNAGKSGIVKYWTKERMENAIPRDLVIDQRGLGYMRRPDGLLVPYGHRIEAETLKPLGKPTGNSDTTPPTITNMDPDGITIQGSYTFSAKVTDVSGIKSVNFIIVYPDGSTTQIFSASKGSNDTWSVSLQGFFDGNWSWWVEAKDRAAKGGNSATSAEVAFTVDTGGGTTPPPPSGSDTIINQVWNDGGTVQTAAGRIYFEMPNNMKRKGPWQGYVCSGTVVDDGTSGRSVILTAGHCVYDDANKAFARNVMFIPDQAGTTGSGTDLTCSNDPLGCWVPSFGVVDVNWTAGTFPANKRWDYAYYVVDDSGAHAAGIYDKGDILDTAAGTLLIKFDTPAYNDGVPGATSPDFTNALGYSYSYDPYLMYCAEDMTTIEGDDWWLPSCELSGGSSGGPWVQPMDTGSGSGPLISVNSWGYTNSPGMAGPMLDSSSAGCIFETAITGWTDVNTDGDAGIIVNNCQ